MTEQRCEQIQVAVMALRDGEEAPLGRAEVEAHLAGCSGCQRDLRVDASLRSALEVLAPNPPSLWPHVSPALAARPVRVGATLWLAGAGGLLLAVRVALALEAGAHGWVGRALPAIVLVAVFAALRLNPLRISEVVPRAQLTGQASTAP
jgi:anti-sigma factor RsiW